MSDLLDRVLKVAKGEINAARAIPGSGVLFKGIGHPDGFTHEQYADAMIEAGKTITTLTAERDELVSENSKYRNDLFKSNAERDALAKRVGELEGALLDVVYQVTNSRLGTCGEAKLYTPQISVKSVERWRGVLSQPEGGGDEHQ